jgi:cytochrome c551/c552
MVSRAVRQADQRNENRQNAGCHASHGLRKKTRGPGHRPTEHDYRGRVHENTFLPQRVQTLRR